MANAATTGTVNKKLVNQVLRRLIRAATDPASQQDEVVAAQNEAALRGYLADARTCDMVYDKILERVLTDMTQSVAVVARAVSLLAAYLPGYTPRNATLNKIDIFCQTAVLASGDSMSSGGSGAVGGSSASRSFGKAPGGDDDDDAERADLATAVSAVREFIAQVKGDNAAIAAGGSGAGPSGSRASTSTSGGAGSGGSGGGGDDGEGDDDDLDGAGTVVRRTPRKSRGGRESLERVVVEQRPASASSVVCSFLYARSTPSEFAGAAHPQAGSLFASPLFAPQFVTETNKRKIPVVSAETAVAAVAVPPEAVARVQDDLREKDYAHDAVPASKTRLFQYKFYADQAPLVVSEDEFDEIINMVVNPTDQNTRISASKVLTKALMDLFASQHPHSTSRVLMVMVELLQQTAVASRLHAFTLFFNLAVHSAMLAEWHSLQAADPDADRGDHEEALDLIQSTQGKLLRVLNTALLHLVYDDESSGRVLTAGLKAMVFCVARAGSIVTSKSHELDPRIFVMFLRRLRNLSISTRKFLWRALCSAIYADPTALDVDLVRDVCGLDFFLQAFATTQSLEVQANVFTVLFDHIIHRIRRKKKVEIKPGQPELVFELLKRHEAHTVLPMLLKHVPRKFVEEAIRFLFFRLLRRNKDMHGVSQALDKTLIVTVLYEFEKLASSYQNLNTEFKGAYDGIVANAEANAKLDVLRALLTSPHEEDRRNGANFLLKLLRAASPVERKIPDAAICDAVVSVHRDLLENEDPRIRAIFVSVVERYTFYLLAHDAADEAYAFLNESMGLVARTGEADAQNLVAAFGVVMSLVAFPCARAEEHPYANDPVDSAAERFMAGRLLVADYVLARLDAPWLHYLYCHVGPVRRAERAALLSLLIAKVRAEKAVVETFGGMNFFKQEMTSPDGTLAFLAAEYLVDQLGAEHPTQYSTLVDRLKSRASREGESESDLDNPFFLMRSILALRGTRE